MTDFLSSSDCSDCPTCHDSNPPETGLDLACPRCLLRAALLTPQDPLPRPFGKYQLESRMGAGGAGIVYRAYDPAADRFVALKMLRDGQDAPAEEVRRFQDESRRAASLDHEGIVRVHEVGSWEGQPYFTMKLFPTGALSKHLPRFHDQPQATARLVADAARAVHHAHQRFVLHRDLKPANILLDEDGRPHLADFGIAQRLDARRLEQETQSPVGTLPYMAPEQISTPGDLTVAVDVYGLGAILYELLCARPPKDGDTVKALLFEIAEREVTPPSDLRPNAPIPADLEAICLKCLRRDPAERYPSAAGLAADLQRFLDDEPVLARPSSRRERLARMVRRHPVGVAAGALVLALLSATSLVAVSVARAQERELRAEVLTVNAYAARALSGAVLYELRTLADELQATAQTPAVAAVLRKPHDPNALADWRRTKPVGFDSLLILDTAGTWLARVPVPEVEVTEHQFDWRDYFQGGAELGRKHSHEVFVSRAYVSRIDGTSRISLITPVYDADGSWLGLLQGAVDATSTFGAIILEDAGGNRIATMVARRDRAFPTEPLPDEWLVVIHKGVDRGSVHHLGNPAVLATLPQPSPNPWSTATTISRTDDDFLDPVRGFEKTRWLAGIAPVGAGPFAIIVQTRYDAAVAPQHRLASRLSRAGGVTLATMLVLGVVVLIRRSTGRNRSQNEA